MSGNSQFFVSELSSNNGQYDNAVYVRSVHKKYDNGPPVLNNYCMTVKRGTIYGLLGASGCGKTTLLSCIVGLRQWDSGEVLVFGKKRLEAKRDGELSKKIGYMPQDEALYSHLSIMEIMQFYGRLYNMQDGDVLKQWKHITKLLELPTAFKLISEMSGGQKRRVSLAVTLLHSPELLVLDEPTTGMDPLLKLKIWDYLYQLVKNLGTTIIVTTHYTEEAKLSDTIGVMRRGHLLVEDTPKHLMEIYQTDLLEKVVLQLCSEDEAVIENSSDKDRNQNKAAFKSPWKTVMSPVSSGNLESNNGVFSSAEAEPNSFPVTDRYKGSLGQLENQRSATSFYQNKRRAIFDSLSRTYGLSAVFMLTLKRFPWFLAVLLLMPSIQGSITLAALGSNPANMPFGVVNHEISNWTEECDLPSHKGNSCDLSALSCKYINRIRQTDALILRSYDSEEEALGQVQLGKLWGYLSISQNYSQNMVELVAFRQFSENETMEGSKIAIHLDYSQFIAAFFILKNLQISFIEYLQQLAPLCGINARQAEIPLLYHPAVYGSYDDSFTEYVMPGIIMCSLFITVSVLTGLILITDKKQGTLSRSTVAGLRTIDIIAGHLITQAFVVICQVIIWNLVLKYVFDFSIVGSFTLWILLLFLAGMCGATLGIFLGIVCRDEVQGLVVGVFLFVVCVLLGGAVFPVEYMSTFWQYVGKILPPALPIISLRSVITRGLGFMHFTVWPGFVGLIVWIIVLGICSMVAYRFTDV